MNMNAIKTVLAVALVAGSTAAMAQNTAVAPVTLTRPYFITAFLVYKVLILKEYSTVYKV